MNPSATPEQVALHIATKYANCAWANGYPFTISALDLTQIAAVRNTLNVW